MSTSRSLNWKDFPTEAATAPFPIPERTPPVTKRYFVIQKDCGLGDLKIFRIISLMKLLRVENIDGYWMSGENLKVEIGKLKLRNPTILAAGILDQTGSALERIWNSGAGAVVTKSVGLEPKEGYPGPNVVETPCGLLNAMGLPNPGIENMVDEIRKIKDEECITIGSIFGKNREEFKKVALEMQSVGVDAVELNLSCPHAEGLSTIGHNPESTAEIVRINKEIEIPVWVKLPGNTHISNFLKVVESAESAGADALVITNTLPAMTIDADAERPTLGHNNGGLSGPAMKPIGIRLVYEAYENVDIPIIGVGGVRKGKDVVEYMLAGASAVELGTSIIWEGLEIFGKVCDEALDHLNGKSFKDIRGRAHEA